MSNAPETASSIESQIWAATRQFIARIDNGGADLRAAAAKPPCYATINSSFILREKSQIKTTQSSERLLAELAVHGSSLDIRDIVVESGEDMRGHFRMAQSPPSQFVSLPAAIDDQISKIGDLVFVLLGTSCGLRAAQSAVGGSSLVRELRLVPTQAQTCRQIDDSVYGINRLIAIEDIFQHIEANLGPLGTNDRQAIAKAYEAIIEGSTTDVALPHGPLRGAGETTLGMVASSIKQHAASYRSVLAEMGDAKG